jgi:hypothetical protein
LDLVVLIKTLVSKLEEALWIGIRQKILLNYMMANILSHIIDAYLDYFEMTHEEFDTIIDMYANKNLFRKQNGRWTPTFDIK